MFEELCSILKDELQVKKEITEESELADLGVNSLELADLVMHCEEKFDIEIKDDDIHDFITVKDLVNYIEKKVKNK